MMSQNQQKVSKKTLNPLGFDVAGRSCGKVYTCLTFFPLFMRIM
jgi:hypothetical protein